MEMIYDTFCFFNELDLLEIRLNILDKYVDKFVICESYETFSGKAKPLYYEKNKQRFKKWEDKIIHLVPPKIVTDDAFERAGFQKDFIRKSLNLGNEDIFFFGDVDEIWNPYIFDKFTSYDLGGDSFVLDDKVYNLKQLNYSYYLNNRSSEQWVGTIMGKWEIVKTNTLNHWRATHDKVLPDGGWHFTNCMGYSNILKKLDSYDHQEANIPWVRDNLKYRIENGQDYLGRAVDWKGNPFKMWIDDFELPEYILENKEKYKHLWKS